MQQLFHITKRIFHPSIPSLVPYVQTFTFIPLGIMFHVQKSSNITAVNEDQIWEEILLNNVS